MWEYCLQEFGDTIRLCFHFNINLIFCFYATYFYFYALNLRREYICRILKIRTVLSLFFIYLFFFYLGCLKLSVINIRVNPTEHVGLEQSGPHHHLIEN